MQMSQLTTDMVTYASALPNAWCTGAHLGQGLVHFCSSGYKYMYILANTQLLSVDTVFWKKTDKKDKEKQLMKNRVQSTDGREKK
jgi:hypothetical protein